MKPSNSNDVSRAHWEALHQSMLRFILTRVPSKSIAEDLTQETFLKISKRIESLKDSERLEAWSYQIARNTIADYYRKKSREIEAEPTSDEIDGSGNLNATVASWLPEMIRELSSQDQALVQFTEFEGRTIKEAASSLGLSYASAKSRAQRIRKKLKRDLLQCCHLELDQRGNVIDYRKNDCDC